MKIPHEEKAVILARVSTAFQANEGTSLEDQTVACTGFAERQGWGIHQVYREDASGGLYSTRTALQSAILDIEAGRATVFVTFAIDRSAREARILDEVRRRVLEAGGRYILANGMEFADNPMADFMFGSLANMAQFERSSIRSRTVGGRISRAKEGKQPSRTWSPYSYRVVTKADVLLGHYPAPLLGTYQVIPEKVQWVTGAYSRFAAGASMREIRRWFKENGVLTAEGLPEWSISSIQRLLSHPVYKGQPAFGRTKRQVNETRVGRIGRNNKILTRVDFCVLRPEEEWIILEAPPLVPEDVWNECQRRLALNRSERSGNPKRKFMLGGMVVCPMCSKVTGGQTSNNKNRSRYYRCVGCKWSANATHAELFTTHAVITVAERPELTAAALRAYEAKHKSGGDETAKPRLREELARMEKKRNAALEAELEARMDDPSPERDARVNAFREKQREITARAEELRVRLIAVHETGKQHQDVLPDLAKIATAVASVREALESDYLTNVEKNEILSAVVAAVKPNEDRTHIVLVLRPFFCGVPSETVPQILIRVIGVSNACHRGALAHLPQRNSSVIVRVGVGKSAVGGRIANDAEDHQGGCVKTAGRDAHEFQHDFAARAGHAKAGVVQRGDVYRAAQERDGADFT